MEEITPYRSLDEAKQVLDNGGRFYNLLTRAGDEEINAAELARAAGVYMAQDQAVLYLELALAGLGRDEQLQVRSLFSAELAERVERLRPLRLGPGEVDARGEAGRTLVVEGYPRFAESKEVNSFIMMPMRVGEVTTFTMIPITNRYDVYRLHESPTEAGPNALVATVRGRDRLGEGKLRLGGILKERKAAPDESADTEGLFLETLYFTPCQADRKKRA